jgi:hypothetical protein
MWAIKIESMEVPLISNASAVTELQTKTKVLQESDDSSAPMGLDITTKTAADMESDDVHPHSCGFF